jgi:ABC-2 type transport system permease protein
MMSPMMTIAKREFRSYFDSPLAYIVICLTFFLLGLAIFVVGGFWKIDRASMHLLFQYMPLALTMLVVPVVTMRSMAEEKRSGTLEMLITLPVRDSDVILGKYLGALGLVLILVVATALYPICMFWAPWNLGPLDMGPVLSGYLGLILFSSTAVAIGLLVSSLAESQAVAFFVTFFVLIVLWFMGTAAEHVSKEWLANALMYMSFQSRLEGFSRGLIDTRDVVFFLSALVLALVFSFRALERRKWV